MFNVPKIKDKRLCLGCGLCQSFSSTKMKIAEDGFIYPEENKPISGETGSLLKSVCPAINIDCIRQDSTPLGHVVNAYVGWSDNKEIRHKSSSGGIITSLCCFLLENHLVDGIIQVRKSPDDYMHNEVHISRNRQDIIDASSSRYAPVSMFDNIKQILDSSSERFAFVGKPCDIMTITRLVEKIPSWKSRILYKISLVCAGTPSYLATEKLINIGKNNNQNIEPVDVRYRGEGWPGNFKVSYTDKSTYSLNYNDSWGKVLGRQLNMRCKICPDGIGNFADIVVGDYWHTKNGYPDFTEQDGKCFIFVRTQIGQKVIDQSSSNGYIHTQILDLDKLPEVQPYQYNRLKYAGYKLAAAKLFLGNLIRIKHWRIESSTFISGVRIFMGTIKRMIKAYGH